MSEVAGDLPETQVSHTVSSLAQVWAKKYVQGLTVDSDVTESTDPFSITRILSQEGRQQTVEKLQQALRFTSAQAWSKTESLLAPEVQKHNINTDLIDPWQIAVDSHALFDKTLDIYARKATVRQVAIAGTGALASRTLQSPTDLTSPGKLATEISKDVGRVRHKYTNKDPRVIGFVSMQFHYSGQLLLDLLSSVEREAVSSYFKVIDDHLYMPLQRSYDAAADHSYDSEELLAVRDLLPITSELSASVCEKVIDMYPNYRCYSGVLKEKEIKISSLRDVEMFQIYLCLCVLEGNIDSIQQELFPLCVMLYPPLKVSWGLIRNMLRLLGQEMSDRLSQSSMNQFRPYVRALWSMFSEEILPDENQ